MCPECFALYAEVSDLHSQLVRRTSDLADLERQETEQYEGLQTEVAQLRLACAEARKELQLHRDQH